MIHLHKPWRKGNVFHVKPEDVAKTSDGNLSSCSTKATTPVEDDNASKT